MDLRGRPSLAFFTGVVARHVRGFLTFIQRNNLPWTNPNLTSQGLRA